MVFGSHSGVAKRVQQSFPNVVLWNCFDHCLELAVGNAFSEINGINHFKILFNNFIIIFIHSSAKNKRELEECCQKLSEQFFYS